MLKEQILEIMVYINFNLFSDLTLETLAKEFSYSKYYLHRIFKKEIGETPIQYVRKKRIEKSIHYLFADMDKSITEIAEYCGFSLATYSRKFKKIFGKSPTEWRDIVYNFEKTSEKSNICKTYRDYICYSDNESPREIKDVAIVNIEQKQLQYLIFYGNFHCEEFIKIWNRLKYKSNTENNLIGIPIDAPTSTDPDKCLFVVAYENYNAPHNIFIYGGEYLKVGFKGAFKKMEEVYSWIFKFYLEANNLKYDFRTQFQEFGYDVDFSKEEIKGNLYIPIKNK